MRWSTVPVEVALGIKPGNIIPGRTAHVTELFVVARYIRLLVVLNGPLYERDCWGTYRSGQSSSMSSLSVTSSRRIIAPSDRNSRLPSPSIVCLTSAMIFVMSTGHRSKSQYLLRILLPLTVLYAKDD